MKGGLYGTRSAAADGKRLTTNTSFRKEVLSVPGSCRAPYVISYSPLGVGLRS